ncbi:MAG: tRNA pseudouridine(55) synthase TruB [Rikenellaceae bacterium]|jgi:tRNA pseudouridine55 synthase|nr:tRNA pseudouridine(55) synthase TruB [Rikenellaceae bacterium]
MKVIDKNRVGVPDDLEAGWVLVVDKPPGWSSSDVVRKIKFRMRSKGYRKIKVGHAGTLDPLATGVLLVCLGRATKRVEELQAERKEYVTDIVLGATTPSYDMEHPVDRTYPHEHIDREMIDRALEGLCGERLQTPPLYSAKMIDGRRAYEYAREGSEVELRRALIEIYSMIVESYDHPTVRVRIECSKGTYIRSIARELGEALGSGAYLSSLRRTASGGHRVEEALSLEETIKFLEEINMAD